jgi:hypothetical protein
MSENTFMSNQFQKLPSELQAEIMIHHGRLQRRPPKFKPGQCVRYKQSRVNEMRATFYRTRSCDQLGAMPFGQLRIWGTGHAVGNSDWKYDYEYGYGGTSEGSAYESDLIPY